MTNDGVKESTRQKIKELQLFFQQRVNLRKGHLSLSEFRSNLLKKRVRNTVKHGYNEPAIVPYNRIFLTEYMCVPNLT